MPCPSCNGLQQPLSTESKNSNEVFRGAYLSTMQRTAEGGCVPCAIVVDGVRKWLPDIDQHDLIYGAFGRTLEILVTDDQIYADAGNFEFYTNDCRLYTPGCLTLIGLMCVQQRSQSYIQFFAFRDIPPRTTLAQNGPQKQSTGSSTALHVILLGVHWELQPGYRHAL